MPTTYGIARQSTDQDEREVGHDASATSPLLGGDATPKRVADEGIAGIPSSVGNLANTIIGSGMLTFPLAMASTGLIPGILSCLFCGSVSVFGLYLLTRCATKAPPRRSSFFVLAQLTVPKAAVWFDFAIAVKCFGVSSSYLIIIKTLMPSVVAAVYHVLSPHDPPSWALSGRIWLFLLFIPLLPLCFMRKLDSLRHTSYIALFSIAYLVAIVVICYFRPPEGSVPPGKIYWFRINSTFVSTFPVQVFAFTCSQNIFPIYNELVHNTQERMNIIMGSALGGATLTYEIIAVFGYLTFGSNVGANIIAMYPDTTLFIACGQVAIIILVMFSYALQVHPCRICLDKVLHAWLPGKADSVVSTEEYDDEHAADMSWGRHVRITAVIVSIGFLIAYFVDDLKLVLSFVGSTGSTTLSFILPGMFYYLLFRNDPDANKMLVKGSVVLFFYGIFICVFCLSYNIYLLWH